MKRNSSFSQMHQNESMKIDLTNILARISITDKSAIKDCVFRYGNEIWTLAGKYFSDQSLEEVVREIFLDIWKYADKFDSQIYDEKTFIKLLAVRRLEKFKRLS